MTSDEGKRLRALFRQHHKTHAALADDWAKRGYQYPPPDFPVIPDDLRGMMCKAKTRAGTPCKQKAIYINGRCKWHGGLSTGPQTEVGKEQARINGRKGGRPKRKPDS